MNLEWWGHGSVGKAFQDVKALEIIAWLQNPVQGWPARLCGMKVLESCVPGNKLTQDNSDSGVQFITPAGPSQSLLLAKDPDQHCENLLYPMCTCPNHYPKFLETYINKGRVNTITITPSFMCYVFKQLIISPQLHSDRLITDKPVVTFR